MIEYQQGELFIDQLSAQELASSYGTPLYVYSQQQLTANCRAYSNIETSLDLSLHYAVKANNNATLLKQIYQAGLGFDIVSGGELLCCLKTGIDPQKIVYSGVGKSTEEIQLSLKKGIGCINVESFAELERVNTLALEMQLCAPITLRINPHIDAKTHPSISTALADSKFGIHHHQALEACHTAIALEGIDLKGIVCHIGSQIQTLEPYDQACDSMIAIYDALAEQGKKLDYIGLGGGLGVDYQGDTTFPSPQQLVNLVEPRLRQRGSRLALEPGRSIVANTGVTLTRIEYIKSGEINFAVIDAAMNDVPRPAMYDAWHKIQEVSNTGSEQRLEYSVVGPICESTDLLGKDRSLAVKQGDLLAIFDTGAYTSVMASNYNSRPRAASVLVCDDQAQIIRARETLAELYA